MGATLPAEVVTIGTELLLGFTLDRNAAVLGTALAEIGVTVARRATVGDTASEIRDAVDAALARTGLVITTGGLGPTRDDITKAAIAELLDMPLAFDDTLWAALVRRWESMGRVIAESNRSQAMVPVGGAVLPNKWGSAPGLWLESPRGVVILLPGVPFEMRNLLQHEVIPRLATRAGDRVIRSRMFRTSGIAESTLGERVATLSEVIAPLTIAYLPDLAGVDLRITAWGLSAAEADARLDAAAELVRARVGDWIYAEDSTDLAEVLLRECAERGKTVALAESCTGGLLGARLTAIAGASSVFRGSAVTYSDDAKSEMLGVDPEVVRRHGAVSPQVAEAMVRGAVERLGTDLGVAITGIAGPAGGSEEKPVGTVWFAFAVDGVVDSAKLIFPGTRAEVQTRAVQTALLGLLRRVRGARSPGGTVI